MLPNPLALIAEITHRCPLHCVYCSNPIQMSAASAELTTEDWIRVFEQAGRLGILHVHLTGGEPLARQDLVELVASARASGLYSNLITSGIGLNRERLAALVESGLDHIQLSFQDSREDSANWIAGTKAHAHKVVLSRFIREHQIAFTANLVVHRQNLDHLEEMLVFLESLNPDRIEVAHTQYYGWAHTNRSALMPTRAQSEESMRAIALAQERTKGRIRIDSVLPDYFAKYPKACMGGWGKKLMLIDPTGRVLPCHAAAVIPGIDFENVRTMSLSEIWRESDAFRKFRGEEWMQEPCRSCDRRTEDFGGCRCQALLLTGDAAATDPVCSLSPRRELVDLALKSADDTEPPRPNKEIAWTYRPNPTNA